MNLEKREALKRVFNDKSERFEKEINLFEDAFKALEIGAL